MRVLHVASEVYPLIKTGGLADVVAALPPALAELGADVRLLLPGLPAVLDAVQSPRLVLQIGACFGAMRVSLLLARMPGSQLPVYIVDAPYLYRRAGSPYQSSDGREWPDNLQRFGLLGWVAAHLAAGDADLKWQPDVLHAHDWHAALACAFMAENRHHRARSVFTVHNLAFQGLFALDDWPLLGIRSHLLSSAGLEYHGQLSFMKAGLKYADRITTVSPRYAREIATAEFGCGLDGVIRGRGAAVLGILNGIDEAVWNPASDPAIAARYDAERLQGKLACRLDLQQAAGLAPDGQALLISLVSRLTSQKGLDLVLAALPALVGQGVQLAVQGTGDAAFETALQAAARAHPGRVAVHIGYDEARAHRMIAGADVVAVPSRFEPCGLTQLYGLRYGTLPLVREVGGLADTVDDGQTGFVFAQATPQALQACVQRAVQARADASAWQTMLQRAMARPLGWAGPARQYMTLYQQLADEANGAFC